MPFGYGMGFVYFGAVKAAGYTGAASILKGGYNLRESPKPEVWKVGLTRTAIGIGAGALYGVLWYAVLRHIITGDQSNIFFFALLLPVRIVEWCLLIWIFFDRGLRDKPRLWKFIAFGIAVSFALDAVGMVAAFVLPGGFWIC